MEGYFDKEADEILENLQNHEEFESELSFVSIVGGKGVGKSTMASLLSGNSSMFLVNNLFKINSKIISRKKCIIFFFKT